MHQAEAYLAETHAAQRRGQVRGPQTLGLDPLLHRQDHLTDLVIGQIQRLEREHLFPDEFAHPRQLRLELGLGREIPGHALFSLSSAPVARLPGILTLPLPWAP